MADKRKATDGPSPFADDAYDFSKLPDFDNDFVREEDFLAFARALTAPETAVLEPDLKKPPQSPHFITALNDWRPIHQRVRKDGARRKKRKPPRRGKDETREGFVYTILKWPLLLLVLAWIICLGAAYLLTRLYIFAYEQYVTMRGKREVLRKRLQSTTSYGEWVRAAKEMDRWLGNDRWKQEDDYAYYNSNTVRSVRDELKRLRTLLEQRQSMRNGTDPEKSTSIAEDLRALVEASVKDNFVGIENARLYSETYYGTKDLVQSFVDEVEACLKILSSTPLLAPSDKAHMFSHLSTNYGRTALCLSGGATFAYYHFGVAKALMDAAVLPEVITGTSGGALVAALLATRTDEELKKLLVPALANRITACSEDILTCTRRWWRTGAQFDSVDWAKRCAWFCHGSLTFREAYERTGRILNVTCIPSDPHSPTVLANYLTSPDCVIWSAVLASAAVPGILNPVVLMRKTRSGALAPYSFGHKWKDGSLRTDIPLRALNTHFNVTFSIVSQVNPHINLFFFSSRGTVGRPVTHRRGRGWRGGFLGSAVEQYLKLDLTKWLKVMRHLELLPRYLGQDWSEVWLQRFSGTITIWPKSIPSDFWHILSDPDMPRLARMIHVGQQSCFPKVKFISNRIKVERLIDTGRITHTDPSRLTNTDRRPAPFTIPHDTDDDDAVEIPAVLSEDDLQSLLETARRHHGSIATRPPRPHAIQTALSAPDAAEQQQRAASPSMRQRLGFGGWWSPTTPRAGDADAGTEQHAPHRRVSSVMEELGRQSRVFVDDTDVDADQDTMSEDGAGTASAGVSDAEVDGER